MPDFPVLRNVDPLVISPASPQSIGEMLNAMGLGLTTSTWPTANKAYFIPFSVFAPITIVKMFVINGGTASGNIDVGIYDRGGSRLVSSGSTAQSGTSAVQEFNITDTLLLPGLYYLACAMDNTTGTLDLWNPATALARVMGVVEQTSAFALPSSATFASLSGTLKFPFIGATQRPVV